MAKETPLMNEKEKKYVAFCFSRNASFAKDSLDYERIFNGEMLNYDIQERNKEYKHKFGKRSRRSRKWQRETANTEQPFLNSRLVIAELFEMGTILKCISLDKTGEDEMNQAIEEYFVSSFQEIANEPRLFDFLNFFLQVGSESAREDLLSVVLQGHRTIASAGLLDKFLTGLSQNQGGLSFLRTGEADKIDFDDSWTDSTLVVAIFLLKQDILVSAIIGAFLKQQSIRDSEYLQRMLEQLTEKSMSAEEKQAVADRIRRSGCPDIIGLLQRLNL